MRLWIGVPWVAWDLSRGRITGRAAIQTTKSSTSVTTRTKGRKLQNHNDIKGRQAASKRPSRSGWEDHLLPHLLRSLIRRCVISRCPSSRNPRPYRCQLTAFGLTGDCFVDQIANNGWKIHAAEFMYTVLPLQLLVGCHDAGTFSYDNSTDSFTGQTVESATATKRTNNPAETSIRLDISCEYKAGQVANPSNNTYFSVNLLDSSGNDRST